MAPVNSSLITTCLQKASDKKNRLVILAQSIGKKTLNCHKQNLALSAPIKKDSQFVIPTEYTDFCWFDSGDIEPDWMLIFGDRVNAPFLQIHNYHWLCDGTFKICPMQFYQLITVHNQMGGFYPRCICAVLPNQLEQTYATLLKSIYTVSNYAQPPTILIDFKRAAVNIFGKAYLKSSVEGCYFHLGQAFLRKINKPGLKKAYENNCELSLDHRSISALGFVPTALVGKIVWERYWESRAWLTI